MITTIEKINVATALAKELDAAVQMPEEQRLTTYGTEGVKLLAQTLFNYLLNWGLDEAQAVQP